MSNNITDLRGAIEFLKTIPGQFAETDVPADPVCEIPGLYRYIGAGGTVARPTKEGPAVVFNSLKNHPGTRLTIGMLASRRRVAALLDTTVDKLAFKLRESVNKAISPIIIASETAKCHEVVIKADEPGFDIRKILPVTQSSPTDGGPCITTGLCMATDPETGVSDVTIHRMFITDKPDEITFHASPTRHIAMMFEKAKSLGRPLPITVSIGLDPAVYISACFEPPTTPFGFNELGIAGAFRGKPVELCDGVTVGEKAIANAEFVIEGELIPGSYASEDSSTGSGNAIPEFPGYIGLADKAANVLKIKAVTHRENPIYQTCIGASEEHVNLAGPCTEACLIEMLEKAMPGMCQNVYAHSAGGGKLIAILQLKKSKPSDEGRQRQCGLLAFSAFAELKHVILVDEDVDPFDSSDVLWALTTRYQADIDTIFVPGISCHSADPSADGDYNPLIRFTGNSCKTIFDCTVPYKLKEKFRRAEFTSPNVGDFFPDLA